MTFPAQFDVQYEKYRAGAKNAHGNAVDAWDPPVPRKVIGWGPPQSSQPEPKLAGHDREVVDIEVMVPPDWTSGHRDRITLPGEGITQQIGGVESTAGNPFGWVPGHIINVRRVDG
ncbi:head-to-tail stopper [Gordonia phage Cashline]|nr:head-to-tail stopper [Gordonia phage Cashline]